LGVKVIPDLTVAIEDTSAVDVDVRTAELEESGGVLEDLLECVRLPVVRVVGELDVSLDVEINVLEEGQVECSADNIGCTLREDDMSTIVTRVDGLEDVGRIVGNSVIVALNVAIPVPGGRGRQRLVWLLGAELNLGPRALMLGGVSWQRVLIPFICSPCRRGDDRGCAEQRTCKDGFEQHVSVGVKQSDLPSRL